jgi:hypothetical protein
MRQLVTVIMAMVDLSAYRRYCRLGYPVLFLPNTLHPTDIRLYDDHHLVSDTPVNDWS